MCLCGGRWVGAYYKREKQPYNLSTSLRALTLVKSMEDLRLIKSGKTATGFSGLQDKKKKKKRCCRYEVAHPTSEIQNRNSQVS